MSTPVEASTIDPSMFWLPVGFSDESEETARERAKEYRADRQTPASFAWRDLIIEEVADILETCSDQGWDGYDGEPVSPLSAHSAAELVRNLPEGIQTPTVVPEPDGDIALEWRTEDNRLFSLSVTGPTLIYAGRFGGASRQHGEEPFFGTIPRTILQILTQHFPAA